MRSTISRIPKKPFPDNFSSNSAASYYAANVLLESDAKDGHDLVCTTSAGMLFQNRNRPDHLSLKVPKAPIKM